MEYTFRTFTKCPEIVPVECSKSVPHGTLSEHFIWTLVKCSESVPHGTLWEHFIWTLKFWTLKSIVWERVHMHVHEIYACVIGWQPIRINFDNFRPAMRSIQRLSSTIHESGSLNWWNMLLNSLKSVQSLSSSSFSKKNIRPPFSYLKKTFPPPPQPPLYRKSSLKATKQKKIV